MAAHQFYVYELGSGRTRATNLEKYSALPEQCVDGCRCLCDSTAQHTNAEMLFSCSYLFIKTGKAKSKYKLKAGLYFTETSANCSDVKPTSREELQS